MNQSQFSLSWDEHGQNICSGLSLLQQNGEFVDMTLAADGYHVKVHQVIIALSSPFLKNLITAAQCPHPVIVLNKLSHNTLAAILQYIYTGEVLVAVEDINELIDAAKELHIKGLKDMNLSQALSRPITETLVPAQMEMFDEDDIQYYEISNPTDDGIVRVDLDQNDYNSYMKDTLQLEEQEENERKQEQEQQKEVTPDMLPPHLRRLVVPDAKLEASQGSLQYTVSNQGSLQLILNRYVYYLKHANKDNSRQWRCVNYLNNCKCPALVVTLDDVVVQRISPHNHNFHDKKILTKVKSGAIFTTLLDAEKQGANIKNQTIEDDESE